MLGVQSLVKSTPNGKFIQLGYLNFSIRPTSDPLLQRMLDPMIDTAIRRHTWNIKCELMKKTCHKINLDCFRRIFIKLS